MTLAIVIVAVWIGLLLLVWGLSWRAKRGDEADAQRRARRRINGGSGWRL